MSEDRKDYLLDVEKVLGPKLMKKLPRFAVNFFKRRIHQDEINDCIMHAEHYKGAGFFDEALNYVGITFKIRGEENLDPGKKYLFAGNHPLGGPEALIIGSVFRRIYGDGFKVPVNHLLANLKPLNEFFVPVRVYGSNRNRELGEQIADMFRSDYQVLVFPAGMCARKIKGKVTEMPWKKMFIFFTKLSTFLKLKFNLGMIFLVDELFNKKGQEFVVTFGKPVPYTTFDKTKTDLQWAAEIKDQVEALSKDNGCPANM